MKTLTEIAIEVGANVYQLVGTPKDYRYQFNSTAQLQSFVDAVNAERGEAVAYERFTEFGWIPLNVTDMQHYVEKGCKIRELYTVPQPPVDQSEYIKRLEDALTKIAVDRVIDSQGRRLVLIAQEALASKGEQ